MLRKRSRRIAWVCLCLLVATSVALADGFVSPGAGTSQQSGTPITFELTADVTIQNGAVWENCDASTASMNLLDSNFTPVQGVPVTFSWIAPSNQYDFTNANSQVYYPSTQGQQRSYSLQFVVGYDPGTAIYDWRSITRQIYVQGD